jgi:hypothetical protein
MSVSLLIPTTSIHHRRNVLDKHVLVLRTDISVSCKISQYTDLTTIKLLFLFTSQSSLLDYDLVFFLVDDAIFTLYVNIFTLHFICVRYN